MLAASAACGRPRVVYNKLRPTGKDTISHLFKTGAKLLGITDYSQFTGHALRANYVTKVVNLDLNPKEKLCATRHATLNAQITYVQPSEKSEVIKLQALGLDIPDGEKNLPAKVNVRIVLKK